MRTEEHGSAATELNNDALLKLVQSKYQQNAYDDNSVKIINVIGGIDSVLHDYVSLFPESLTQKEIKQITALHSTQIQTTESLLSISSQTTFVEFDKTSKNSTEQQKFTLTFDKTNNFLVSVFGTKTGPKIFNLIYNKYIVGFIVVGMFALNFNPYLIVNIAYEMVAIPYVMLVIMSVNRTAFKTYICKSFQFWVQIFYMIVVIICYLYEADNKTAMAFIWNSQIAIILVLDVVFVACFDGLHISNLIKAVVGTSLALIMSAFAIIFTFFSFDAADNDGKSVIYLTAGIAISVKSIKANAMRIVSMFLWKQNIYSILWKQRCSLIQYSPYIEWHHETHTLKSLVSKISLQMNSNKLTDTNDVHTIQQFLTIIGGIKVLLNNYLSVADLLTSAQLSQIYELLNSDLLATLAFTDKANVDNMADSLPTLTYKFNFKDTILWKCFGPKLGVKVRQFVYSGWFVAYATIMTIGFVTIDTGILTGNITLIPTVLLCILSTFACLLMTATADINGLKIIAQTFSFWIKVLYTIIAILCGMYLRDYSTYSSMAIRVGWMVSDVIFLLYNTLLTIAFSVIDTMEFKKSFKMAAAIIVSLGVTARAITASLTLWNEDDLSIIHISKEFGFSVSVNSLYASSWRIVALFMLKQATYTIINKDRSDIIAKSPYIRWIDGNAGNCNTKGNQMQLSQITNNNDNKSTPSSTPT